MKTSQRDHKNLLYFNNIINITNAYINLEHWLLHFKIFISIIIPKLNKVLYNTPKTFRPIVLLNMLDKLIQALFKNIINSY